MLKTTKHTYLHKQNSPVLHIHISKTLNRRIGEENILEFFYKMQRSLNKPFWNTVTVELGVCETTELHTWLTKICIYNLKRDPRLKYKNFDQVFRQFMTIYYKRLSY